MKNRRWRDYQTSGAFRRGRAGIINCETLVMTLSKQHQYCSYHEETSPVATPSSVQG